jgi:hypothetical protein
MVKGDNDVYLYHLGDEFSKAFDFHQADLVNVLNTLHTLHVHSLKLEL